MTEPKTATLNVPGAVLHYDVRDAGSVTHPVLLMIGSPMGADGFVSQAEHFTDRTVVTYDPRGSRRSQRADGTGGGTVEEHADDLRRLIAELDRGQVDIFGSSGGAVNGLALVAGHPELVRTLVAHEPPSLTEVPDREAVLAVCVDIHETYLRSGFGPAMAKFIAFVSQPGLIPAGYATRPGPDPAAYGLPAQDDGSRTDPLLGRNMISCSHYTHDFPALRAAPTRIVLGIGEDSSQMAAGRAAQAVAERLAVSPVMFAGGHDGFITKPDLFAATLRTALAAA